MDSIRKKMQTMKFDIDSLYEKIEEYIEITKHRNEASGLLEGDIRDTGKKVQKFEAILEDLVDKLEKSSVMSEDLEKEFHEKDEDVGAQCRRVLLMEGEATVSVEKLATTVMKLAIISKEADSIIKECRLWENKAMNTDMEIESLDNNLKASKKMATDNETKFENLARSLAMMDGDMKRAGERVDLAEGRVVKIEEELSAIGENQKCLEVSEEKARRREEKYQDTIKQINIKLKQSDSRSEYAEMNVTKLHLRIDELEDEIIREKLKINAVSGQLDDTFNEMLNKY